MARRLEQLHAALGDAEAAPLPATVIKKQVATGNAGNSFGTGTLIITAMISALLGAGMMWLATSGTPAPVNQTFSVKPLPAPPVATVTPLEATLPSPASTEISDKAKVGDMLENWRNAWASRDVAAYLSAYGQQLGCRKNQQALGRRTYRDPDSRTRHRAHQRRPVQGNFPAGLFFRQLSGNGANQDPAHHPRKRRVENHQGVGSRKSAHPKVSKSEQKWKAGR